MSPFEIMYGKPYQVTETGVNLEILGKHYLEEYVISLGKVLSSLHRYGTVSAPLSLDVPVHQYRPGDWVYLRTWSDEPLKEKWKGPFQVLLTTYTAVKLEGVALWIHYSRIKPATSPVWTVKQKGPLRFKLTRES